jgi:DNA-binding response OmpR family regulator
MAQASLSVLVIEDNHALANQICRFLEGVGWRIDYAANGKEGLTLSEQYQFDVIVLDLNLPDIDGLQICEQIKTYQKRTTPVLMLTARDAYEDKAKGFAKGADDYLTKPFDLREFVLRCEALSRRPELHLDTKLEKGQMVLDTRAHQVTWAGTPIKLTNVSFQILHKLLLSYPYPVTRSDISLLLWGDTPPESNALKSHMYNLRKALDAVTDSPKLHTISSVGYQLKDL